MMTKLNLTCKIVSGGGMILLQEQVLQPKLYFS